MTFAFLFERKPFQNSLLFYFYGFSLITIIKENYKRHETVYFYTLSCLFYSFILFVFQKNNYYLLTSNSVNDRILANRNRL